MLKNSNRIRTLFAAAQNLSISHPKVLFERNVKIAGTFIWEHRRGKKANSNLSTLFTPVSVKPTPDDINIGAELTGIIGKSDLLKILSKFYQMKEVKLLLSENGLDSRYL